MTGGRCSGKAYHSMVHPAAVKQKKRKDIGLCVVFGVSVEDLL